MSGDILSGKSKKSKVTLWSSIYRELTSGGEGKRESFAGVHQEVTNKK